MSTYTIAASLLACLPFIAGHGGGMNYNIDGHVHRGNWQYQNNTEGSIQRYWTWDHNVGTLDNPDIACGHTGVPHEKSYHAPVIAGHTVSINYTVEDGDMYMGRPWTFGHPLGPMLAYMARCPDEGCEKVDANSKIWFKIWEAGLLSGTWPDGHWAMKEVYEGANLEIPVPSFLRPGKYLFRHEMLNLQTGPAQWFPNCIQLEVGGEGDKLPGADELVSFPGAYDDGDRVSFAIKGGAEWFYVDNGKNTVYPMPGPAVWQG